MESRSRGGGLFSPARANAHDAKDAELFKSQRGSALRAGPRNPEYAVDRPTTDEYGFFSNAHHAGPHPRWSQAYETTLGAGEGIETKHNDGYAEYAAVIFEGNES